MKVFSSDQTAASFFLTVPVKSQLTTHSLQATRRLNAWRIFPLAIAAVLAAGAGRANAAALVITPTFDSSITSDPNSATIISTINTAINFYDTTFTTVAPTNLKIQFTEMSSGLGESTITEYRVFYQDFISALINASSGDATDTAALAHLPNGLLNPVTNTGTIWVRSAELEALSFSGSFAGPGGFDGIVSLNTSITTPGSPGSNSQYNLLATVEHEIDEVLGLGSDVGSTNSGPAPEDLFRYDAFGNRSYTTSGAAYFSLNGTTKLAQFNNVTGGDYGDWQSNPLPNGVSAQVQDAFATPGSSPSLNANSTEVIALDAIGYNLADAPEPGSVVLCGSMLAMVLMAGVRRRALKKAAR